MAPALYATAGVDDNSIDALAAELAAAISSKYRTEIATKWTVTVATEGASPAAAAITVGGVAAIIGCHIRRTMVYWRHALTFPPNSREGRNGSRWSGALRPIHLLMLASD